MSDWQRSKKRTQAKAQPLQRTPRQAPSRAPQPVRRSQWQQARQSPNRVTQARTSPLQARRRPVVQPAAWVDYTPGEVRHQAAQLQQDVTEAQQFMDAARIQPSNAWVRFVRSWRAWQVNYAGRLGWVALAASRQGMAALQELRAKFEALNSELRAARPLPAPPQAKPSPQDAPQGEPEPEQPTGEGISTGTVLAGGLAVAALVWVLGKGRKRG